MYATQFDANAKMALYLCYSTLGKSIGSMSYSSDLRAKILKVTVIKGREGGRRCDALRPSHHQFWGWVGLAERPQHCPCMPSAYLIPHLLTCGFFSIKDW